MLPHVIRSHSSHTTTICVIPVFVQYKVVVTQSDSAASATFGVRKVNKPKKAKTKKIFFMILIFRFVNRVQYFYVILLRKLARL